MIKLETKLSLNGEPTAFYFHNMDDCRKFLWVFHNNDCDIPWELPMIIPGNRVHWLDALQADESPIERADSNLAWGFHLLKACGYHSRVLTTTEVILVFPG